ncbi:fatty acid--CoA ligase family protein [Streptomyces cocklensis]|uniref:Acyl-CoA synthetase (AMP-forming)/AMP-acid ligase II n=1 Tax=Actinacidiphila cocklensis TaxID=887465 RepID=A0A9W4E3D6_9ACTN|nr:fatty acid--CoA ligase family protein [Actinacidiphila cocklensis]MDD1057690.1 fatty acid--CoA ligase family protein [Actinacidiphila cocklensis]CAG6398390.1 Acyl-CoA synthetase (AMP-forming)/AMP-acid ligase II [Actinacidiphila cocklensis]
MKAASTNQQKSGPAPSPPDSSWVDDVLLAGPGADVCLVFDAPVSRDGLRRLVAERQAALIAAGLRAGGTAALCLAPSPALVSNLLAGWRIGAQVALLDHRLTPFETERALGRLESQVVVSAEPVGGGPARGFYAQRDTARARPGSPARTPHALVQLSSGSTGPSKIIGRTAADLIAEIGRYARMDGVPRAGERIVSMASMVHVLGLVGGLLHSLHAGVQLAFPARMTGEGILATVAAGPQPTTLLGVPFHIELLSWVANPPPLPQLTGMTTGGELVRAQVHDAFVDRYGIRLGSMYGMTEVGVIATDLFGEHRPEVTPAPGITVRESRGELLVATEQSPYLGTRDASRWSGGWLHTRDGGTVDPDTGRVRVLGRLDSQVSVGGLKVDLTEVEHTLAALPQVADAVVVFGTSIEAYAVLREAGTGPAVEAGLAERLAAYKRPRLLHFVDRLPRTATGKLLRDQSALRAAARDPHRPSDRQQATREGNPRDVH